MTDRFGDNGIVGVMMARADGGALDIDTFLLSCRVMGRAVETAMLAYLCATSPRAGPEGGFGQLIPTAKNVPVRELFEKHGFARTAEEASGRPGGASRSLKSGSTGRTGFASCGARRDGAPGHRNDGEARHGGCARSRPRRSRDDTSSRNTPRWDSANHIQLILALEEEFGVSFEVAELESMLSFGAVMRTLQGKLQAVR